MCKEKTKYVNLTLNELYWKNAEALDFKVAIYLSA